MGLPVVAANTGALPELVHHGANGLLFAPDDSADLAACLQRVISDASLRQGMSERALETVIPHDRQHIVAEWQRLYTNLAARLRETYALRRRGSAWRIEHGVSSHLAHRKPARTPAMAVARGRKGKPRRAPRRSWDTSRPT